MLKDPSPLLGYNNNIRHRNRVFHVQTEDSGVKHPHVITHLFMDGGRILKSVKTGYGEHVGAEKMQDLVRQMMKEQHKAMLISLRDGQFDHLMDGMEAPKPAGAETAEAKNLAVAHARTEPHLGASRALASAAPAPAAKPPPVPAQAQAKKGVSVPPMRRAEATIPDDDGPPTIPEQEMTVDIEVLERAAAESSSPRFEPQNDLPPPPANLLRSKEHGTGGEYRTLNAPTDRSSSPLPPAPGRPPPGAARRSVVPQRPDARVERPAPGPVPKAAAQAPQASRGSGEGRYAPARPAAIFGQARPKRGNSIFGEDLISDKSLDEVILSYLAEDLEAPAEKKKK